MCIVDVFHEEQAQAALAPLHEQQLEIHVPLSGSETSAGRLREILG